MRRFYQESWQGIPFTKFSHLSFFHLAGSKFYSTFYEAMFSRYSSWEALPLAWRENKRSNALWLLERIRQQRSEAGERTEPFRILSIGSGVGYMEKLMLDAMPDLELYVNEPSTVGLKWLRSYLPADRVFIGFPPLCLPSDVFYDMIYLSAVDYSIATRQLLRLLDALRAQLEPGGQLICLSSSFLQEDSVIGSFVNAIKILIRAVLHYLGVRPQQFWGWRRTRREYQQLFKQAGFFSVSDGFVEKSPETYWIVGK
ncbi:MAG: methyltransferase domain-containing protein [Desulfovibrio sp.]|nr:methyltransferase domain-containing protein [Desulfovibrio sp.]